MNKELLFQDSAWDDYLYWQNKDKKVLTRINTLIKEISRQPFAGIGKPEPLRYGLTGYWSRRISETDRLVYKIDEETNTIYIIGCKGHYEDM